MTHVRLKRRWAAMPDVLYAGAWYPVLDQEIYAPTKHHVVIFKAEDQTIEMHATSLEITEEPHDYAVWGIGRPPSGNDPGIGGAVICPQGHAITGVAPWTARTRCGKCSRDYEIRTDDLHYRADGK